MSCTHDNDACYRVIVSTHRGQMLQAQETIRCQDCGRIQWPFESPGGGRLLAAPSWMTVEEYRLMMAPTVTLSSPGGLVIAS